jgi:polyferredoxin
MFVKRRISQIVSLLLLHSSWGPEFKWFCNPVLSCHSCILAWFACPVGVFVHYSGWHLFPFMAVGMVLVLGVLFGRLLCGWVCPFGFLMDMLYKIPSPKFLLPNWTGYIKYVVLVVMVFLLPFFLGEQTEYSFCRVCPASALQVTIPAFFTRGLTVDLATVIKLVILAGVLVLAVMSSRSFCKVFCPIGAMLAPLNLVSFWAIKPPVQKCEDCGRCDKYCPVNGLPSSRIAGGIPANRAMECVVCHDCQESCLHKECPVRDTGVQTTS